MDKDTKETVDMTEKLILIGTHMINNNYKQAKVLLKELPPIEDKVSKFRVKLAEGVIELHEGDHNKSLECFNEALQMPVVEREAEKIAFLDGLVHRSLVFHKLNEPKNRNTDILNAIDYAEKHDLLKKEECKERLLSLIKGSNTLDLPESVSKHVIEKIKHYSKETSIGFTMDYPF